MKILCIPYTHTLSHISRPLLIAKELRARTNDVIFAGESRKIAFIQNEGFQVLPLYEPDPDMLYGNIRNGKLRFVSDAEIEKMIAADLALYKKAGPDLVLTDGRFSAPISAHIAGIKHAAIVNVSSTEYRSLPYIPFFEWLPDWIIKRNSGLWRQLDILNLKLEMTVFDHVMTIFSRLSRKYGLAKTVTATNCLTGKDLTLLADIPEYFPAKNLPEDYHYIGPLTWKGEIPPPSWWPLKKYRGPLIYITMGSTGISDFFKKVYELFRTSDMSAIITTGGQVQNMEDVEGAVYVVPFMDGDLAIEKCDLVVCHGGNGTIYQALQHGKPVIGIPTIPDQKFNMRRVEALGVGRMLTWKDFGDNPACLKDLIKSVIEGNSFFQNAGKMRAILSSYDAAVAAADIIMRS
jgi:UDP:flavonoid glycosyltransferase YjiC (YdhE family)